MIASMEEQATAKPRRRPAAKASDRKPASKYKATIESETKEGQAVGVNGTPAVFINGRKISGAYPFETFKKIADEELAKKAGKKRG